jgi:hypothetical protein
LTCTLSTGSVSIVEASLVEGAESTGGCGVTARPWTFSLVTVIGGRGVDLIGAAGVAGAGAGSGWVEATIRGGAGTGAATVSVGVATGVG